MTAPRDPAVHAAVLAAGRSQRLGQPKQLVHVDGTSLVRRAVLAALGSGATSVTVVLGAEAAAVAAELDGLGVQLAHNALFASGLASSITCAVRAIDEAAHDVQPRAGYLFLLCDQLALDAAHLRRLIDGFRAGSAPIVASAYAGVLGVPAVFDRSLRAELLALSGDEGGKTLLARHRDVAHAVPFAHGERDLDTPSDLHTALEAPPAAAAAEGPRR